MKRLIIEMMIIAAAIVAIALLCKANYNLKAECDRRAVNEQALLGDVERYKVRDSLSAAKVYALTLTLNDYERAMKADAALMKDLRSKRRELERVAAVQSQTIAAFKSIPKDTIIIRDSVEVPARKVSARDKWYSFDGLMTDDDFEGELVCRDSIIVVETCKMTKCIFKKWRRVKSRSVEVVSKNPHTEILGVQFVVIEN